MLCGYLQGIAPRTTNHARLGVVMVVVASRGLDHHVEGVDGVNQRVAVRTSALLNESWPAIRVNGLVRHYMLRGVNGLVRRYTLRAYL